MMRGRRWALVSLGAMLAISVLASESAHAALNVVAAIPVQARPDSVAINTVTRRVYVAHETALPADSSVTVIDADTNAIVATIPVGKTASDIAVNESTNRVYVTNSDSNSVSVISGACNCVVHTIPISPNAPTAVTTDPVTNRIIVGTADSGHVEIFDGATNSFNCASSVFQFPERVHAVAVNPTNGRIYAQHGGQRGAIVEEANCGLLLNNISLCGGHADELVYNPIDDRFYGAQWNGSLIGGYSGSTGASVFCNGLPVANLWGTAINIAQQKIYTTREHGSSGVWSMSIANPAVVESIDPGLSMRGIAFDPTTCKIFVDAFGTNQVWIGSDSPAPNDCDSDGLPDPYESAHPCLDPAVHDANFDPDADGLTNITEYDLGTDPCVNDTDGDGCADGEELGPDHKFGGERNPLDFWDFFDVTGDQAIDLSDALDILSYFGDPGLPATPGNLRDRDNFGAPQPHQTYESNDGVDLTDVLVNLQSFGDDCSGPP
mgnify:CR=1 FL=1